MEASELKQPHWLEADALAHEFCGCADEAQHREDIARLLAYREAALAEGMERAAVIVRTRMAMIGQAAVDDITLEIGAAKGTSDAP